MTKLQKMITEFNALENITFTTEGFAKKFDLEIHCFKNDEDIAHDFENYFIKIINNGLSELKEELLNSAIYHNSGTEDEYIKQDLERAKEELSTHIFLLKEIENHIEENELY